RIRIVVDAADGITKCSGTHLPFLYQTIADHQHRVKDVISSDTVQGGSTLDPGVAVECLISTECLCTGSNDTRVGGIGRMQYDRAGSGIGNNRGPVDIG